MGCESMWVFGWWFEENWFIDWIACYLKAFHGYESPILSSTKLQGKSGRKNDKTNSHRIQNLDFLLKASPIKAGTILDGKSVLQISAHHSRMANN